MSKDLTRQAAGCVGSVLRNALFLFSHLLSLFLPFQGPPGPYGNPGPPGPPGAKVSTISEICRCDYGVAMGWASLGVFPRSSWWSTLRVFVENSLLDYRYPGFSLHPLCTGAGSAIQSSAFSLWLERWQLGPGALEVGAGRKAAWTLSLGRAVTLSLDLECLIRTEDLPWGGVAALNRGGVGRWKFGRWLVVVGRMGWGPG